MSGTIKRKRYDNQAFVATLKRAGRTVNLDGATVKFLMRPVAGSNGNKVEAAADVIDAIKGRVSYGPAPRDVDTAGVYRAEFEVTHADTTIETFPNGEYINIEILADLNPLGPSGSVSPSASESPSPSASFSPSASPSPSPSS